MIPTQEQIEIYEALAPHWTGWDSGGGCTAWRLDVYWSDAPARIRGGYLLLTADGMMPDAWGEVVDVGYYNDVGSGSEGSDGAEWMISLPLRDLVRRIAPAESEARGGEGERTQRKREIVAAILEIADESQGAIP